jgi:hypothetical protein
MKDTKFVLPKNKLPSKENMKAFLDGHPNRSVELKECIKNHKKRGFIDKTFRKNDEINLEGIYEKIVVYNPDQKNILAVSKHLQGKFRKL